MYIPLSPSSRSQYLTSLFLIIFTSLVHLVHSDTCNTNQNPSCAGVAEFEALCCPAPAICYWASRNGAAACCPAGQSCLNNGAVQTLSYYTTPTVVTGVVVYSSTSSWAPWTSSVSTVHVTTVVNPATTVAGVVTVTQTTGGFILIGTPASQATQTVVINSAASGLKVSVSEGIAIGIGTMMWLLL